MLTYDPGNDEDLHPGERCCGGAVEQQGVWWWLPVELLVMVVGHVGQQGGAGESVGGVQNQKPQENGERRGVGHKLHKRAANHFPHLDQWEIKRED